MVEHAVDRSLSGEQTLCWYVCWRLLRPINCQTYITLQTIRSELHFIYTKANRQFPNLRQNYRTN